MKYWVEKILDVMLLLLWKVKYSLVVNLLAEVPDIQAVEYRDLRHYLEL